MKTVTVDAKRRIRLPEAEPHQVYVWERDGVDRFVLTRVKGKSPEAFPPGSLAKFITPARNREQLALLEGCTLEVPE